MEWYEIPWSSYQDFLLWSEGLLENRHIDYVESYTAIRNIIFQSHALEHWTPLVDRVNTYSKIADERQNLLYRNLFLKHMLCFKKSSSSWVGWCRSEKVGILKREGPLFDCPWFQYLIKIYFLTFRCIRRNKN